MTSSAIGVAPPQLPSKYDIIPIHASDVGAFLRCRRYWAWSSPSKLNLRRRVDINGINFPLWFGSGVHYALEQYYDPFLSRDPVEAFKTWYEYQWKGGVVTEDWLERLYDNDPELVDAELDTYKVKGLIDIHPDPIHEEFEHHYDLGIGMLNFYKEWAPKHDDFVTVAAEAKFSVPLGFEAIDTREESPNYGKKIEVHARGQRDAVIYFPNLDAYGIIDHKTAASIDDDYFTKLEMDPQVNTYIWASQEEAKLHDLPYKRINRVIYNVMRKAYPQPPTILSDGFSPSINRKEESTTAELFAEYIKNAGLKDMYNNNKKWQDYYNYLVTMGDKNFIRRPDIPVIRNPHQVKATGEELKMVAKDMLDENLRIYKHPTGDWLCLKCQFRAPCLAADDGSDYVHMLSDGYETNRGR